MLLLKDKEFALFVLSNNKNKGWLFKQMSNSEAELASKQEQLQTITEKLQSYSSDTGVATPNTVSPEIAALNERIKELDQEKSSQTKVRTLSNS